MPRRKQSSSADLGDETAVEGAASAKPDPDPPGNGPPCSAWLDAMNEGALLLQRDGAIRHANPRFAQMTGQPLENLAGAHWSRFFPAADHARLAELLAKAETHVVRAESRLVAGVARRYPVQVSASPARDGNGATCAVILTDLAERKQLEARLQEAQASLERLAAERGQIAAELRQTKERAEAASRAKNVFLANMSHEIRTPMTAVLGFAQLLLQDQHLSADQRRKLSWIRRSGEHLIEIMNEILEMARIEFGRLTLTPVRFDLSRMLHDLNQMFGLRAQTQGIAFQVEFTAVPPVVLLADETKLRQVLGNLLGNAFKFTPRGGRIALRVRVSRSEAERPSLVAEVEDTGCGMAPEDVARLFEPFFQAEAGRTAGGTGLGLTISRQYARLMGGDLTVQSVLGRGSRFVLEAPVHLADWGGLPAAQGAEPTITAAGEASSPGANPAAFEMPSVDALGRLPAALVSALHAAVDVADYEESMALLDEVSDRDRVLGQQLRGLVQRYEYDALLRLLDQTQPAEAR